MERNRFPLNIKITNFTQISPFIKSCIINSVASFGCGKPFIPTRHKVQAISGVSGDRR